MALKLNPPGRLGVVIGGLGAALAHAATQGAPVHLPGDLTTYGVPAAFGLVLAYFSQRLVSWGVERVVHSFEELPANVGALRDQFDAMMTQLREHQAREEEWQRGVTRRIELLEQDVRDVRRGNGAQRPVVS